MIHLQDYPSPSGAKGLNPSFQRIKDPSNGKETNSHRGKTPASNIVIAESPEGDQNTAHYNHYKSGPGQYRIFVHSHSLFFGCFIYAANVRAKTNIGNI